MKAKLTMTVAVGLAAVAGPITTASAVPMATEPVPAAGKAIQMPAKTFVSTQQKVALDDWGFMRNLQTNRCLEERPGHAVGTGDLPCRGDNDQTWQWRAQPRYGIAAWNLVNRSTNNCLDGSNGRVYTLACNDGIYQVWLRRTDGVMVHYQSDTVLDGDWTGAVYLNPFAQGNNFQKWY
jgi:hypothetical protein